MGLIGRPGSLHVNDESSEKTQFMNEKALVILERVKMKLTGNDFSNALTPSHSLHEKNLPEMRISEENSWRLSRKGIAIHPGVTPDSLPRGVTIAEQVEFLLREATDPHNLCQAFFGWYPFW